MDKKSDEIINMWKRCLLLCLNMIALNNTIPIMMCFSILTQTKNGVGLIWDDIIKNLPRINLIMMHQ